MNRLNMTNSMLFVLSFLVVLGLLLPFSNILFTGRSFYNSTIGLAYCTTESACRHEVGHIMDHDMGDISKTGAFSSAIMMHLVYSIKYETTDQYTTLILGYPGIFSYSENYKPYNIEAGSSPQQELYADIYKLSGGDITQIPPTLRPLFNQSKDYQTIYDSLKSNKIYISNQGVVQMDQLKERAGALWAKVVEHKEVAIRIGCTVVGALIGATVAAVVINATQGSDDLLIEEMVQSVVEEDEYRDEEE